jgi:galactose oxidase
VGFWEVLPEDSQVAAVHAALLPNGEVAYYSGNTGQDIPAAMRIWTPSTGEVREPPNFPDTDVFCSGLTPLQDGRLLVVGGTTSYPTDDSPSFKGSRAAYLLDAFGGWERVPDMAFGRWYPSAIMLPDGRVLVVSGLGDDGGIVPSAEIFNPFSFEWEVLPPNADRFLPLYPRLHVLPNGEVACAGNGADLAILNLETLDWRDVGGHGTAAHRHDDLAVLLELDGSIKLLHTGGAMDEAPGNPGAADAQLIDLAEPDPAWREIAPMNHPRWFPNSALLPDGRLFVCGGGRVQDFEPVLESEVFDPMTETWTADAPMEVPRLYHSTALLLPDGRVWMAGTDGETRMEVYTPDYLLNGPRPEIFAAPESVAYNQAFTIPMTDAADVSRVCFVRLSAVTHAWNMGQRCLPLGFFAAGPEELEIVAPPDASFAPPGHYMLFVINGAGVPAFAPIVQLVAV